MTTDRILPEVGAPSPSTTRPVDATGAAHARGATPAAAGPSAASRLSGRSSALAMAARHAKPRSAALMTMPARAGVLFGVSAAIYAVTLTSIAGMQAQTEADAAARNQPAIDAVARARAANDALEAAIKDADARVRTMGGQYNSVSQDVAAYQAQLAGLSALVAKIQGTAAALKTTIQLPTVTMHGAVGGGGGGVVTTTAASGKT